MEANIQNIELVNDYLNNVLSENEQKAVDTKLKTDSEFKTLFDNQLVFVKGLQRIQLKSEIAKAKQNHYNEKWLKISGIIIVLIGALFMMYTLLFNASEKEVIPNTKTEQNIIIKTNVNDELVSEIVVDSTKVNDSLKTSDKEVIYTTTTGNEKFGSASTTESTYKKRPQNIVISTNKDEIITCNEGTILNIKKGAFINPITNQIVTGKIDLEITEYYKLSDILLANLSTVSNEKQLETGGMLYIKAKQGNTELSLRDGSDIKIQFPTQQKKQGMELFSGEWKNENINWSLQDDDRLEGLDISEELLEEDIEVPFNLIEQAPIFPGCEQDDDALQKQCTIDAISKFITRNFSYDIAYDLGLTGRQRINSMFKIDKDGIVGYIRSRSAHPRLSEEANRVIELLPKMVPGMQRGFPVNVPYSLPIFIDIDNQVVKGKFDTVISRDTSLMTIAEQRSIGIEFDTIYNNRRGMVELIREVMHDKDFPVDSSFIKQWNQYKNQRLIRETNVRNERGIILRKPLFEMEDTKFKVFEDDSITRGGHIIRIPWDASRIPTTTQIMNIVPKRRFVAGNSHVSVDEFEERLADTTDRSISTKDANYYILKTSNLGWINCDRFMNSSTKRIKYKLKIKNADGSKVSMIFKSYKSILPSWFANGSYDFRTVGAGEDIVLLAIRRQAGKLYYDMVETKTEINPKVNFEFKEITIDALKRKLDELDSSVN